MKMTISSILTEVHGIKTTHVGAFIQCDWIAYVKARHEGDTGIITDLYVRPHRRREGIATSLLLIAAQDPAMLTAYYLPGSPAANLLEGLGFKPTGETGIEGQTRCWRTFRGAQRQDQPQGRCS